ncbi:Fibrous Sheath-Interacting Protein 2 [Manis pentadactyla]|nr:Fibrous Sheath-Interacting Protein 2 [Manis pentadactyla]
MILTCPIVTVDFWKPAIKAYTLHVQKHTKTIEKQENKLFDTKAGYDNCENAYFQQWLLQKSRQAASDQELLTKHRVRARSPSLDSHIPWINAKDKETTKVLYPLNDGGINRTSLEAPGLSAKMKNVQNHPPQDIKKQEASNISFVLDTDRKNKV